MPYQESKKGEEEIFKSGAAVETSKITIARKGNKEPEIENDVVIIYKDIESLEGIEIIDTPGTDSIMEKHEKKLHMTSQKLQFSYVCL